jgi:hypothetical protein
VVIVGLLSYTRLPLAEERTEVRSLKNVVVIRSEIFPLTLPYPQGEGARYSRFYETTSVGILISIIS